MVKRPCWDFARAVILNRPCSALAVGGKGPVALEGGVDLRRWDLGVFRSRLIRKCKFRHINIACRTVSIL